MAKLQFSNLDKIFWPELGLTKADLILYYEEIANYILPYLKDRPLSLYRNPDGAHKKGFFQKDVDGMPPEWVQTARIKSKSKGSINYALCQDKPSLLYLANLGCIEFNPWLSRVKTTDRPDYAVLDLDPKGVGMDEVVQVARGIYKLLENFKVPSYVKTSGKTGLHVYIPTGGQYSYDQVKNFAHLLMKIIHQRLPKITTLERIVKKRKKSVYLDYLQNRRGQTLAAPYSLRPTPEATVSTPLKWTEVRKGLDPKRYNIKTIFKRLEKVGDLWEGIFKDTVNLKI